MIFHKILIFIKYCFNTRLSEQRRKKLQELEQKISNLTKKCLEQDRIIKMKAKNDKKVENLNNEIKVS